MEDLLFQARRIVRLAQRSDRGRRLLSELVGWRARGEARFARYAVERASREARAGKQVLLLAHNALMAKYLGDLHEAVAGDPRITFHLGAHAVYGSLEELRPFAERQGLPLLSLGECLRRWWDLVVFADHNAAHFFDPRLKKLLVSHSLTAEKVIGGQLYRYGRRWNLGRGGRPLYDAIFEASFDGRARALEACPELADRIEVVGDLHLDRLSALDADRSAVRRRLGFEEGDAVVLVASTWGPDSWIARMGARLLGEIVEESARGRHRFVISTHPNEWRDPTRRELLLAHERARVRVLPPEEDWAPFMAAADALLADHTGLALTFAALLRPLGLVPVPSGAVQEGTLLSELYEVAPRLHSPSSLGDFLARLLAGGVSERHRSIAARCCDHRGEARARMRAACLRLLDLDVS